MKEIYFAKDNSSFLKRVSKNFIFYSSDAVGKRFPTLTQTWAEKILCGPTPARGEFVPKDFDAYSLEVFDDKIQVYSKGDSKKTVVFVHGWSGHANNFSAFFKPYLDSGYRVVTFDHVAHGSSTGKFANLFLFIQGLRSVLRWVEADHQLAGIVAHSMGGSAVLSALGDDHRHIPLTLLAPVVPFFELLRSSLDNYGISQRWLQTLLDDFQMRYKMNIEHIDPKERIKSLSNPTLILQDQKDSYISLDLNKQYLPENLLGSLHTTENLGHFRLLKSPSVVTTALEFTRNARN
jgi:pimeloyl-ACP methyl ester carboxylesterase